MVAFLARAEPLSTAKNRNPSMLSKMIFRLR